MEKHHSYVFEHALTALTTLYTPQHDIDTLENHGIWRTRTVKVQPCDLTNDVHPLLAYSAFADTPQDLYGSCLPALRLASLFLTEPAYRGWWVKAAYGHSTLSGSGQTVLKLPDLVDLASLSRSTERTLTDLAQYLRIYWTPTGKVVPYMGACEMDRDFRTPGEREYPFVQNSNVCIKLLNDFRESLEREMSVEYTLRLHFRLAVTLVHELAHALVFMRFSEAAGGILHSETDFVCEDGYSWEVFAFGGLITCCSGGYGMDCTPMVFERWSFELAIYMEDAILNATASLESGP
ncbi:uncharacterized protein K452DRAFT_294670 [Aplosporella prunicola CBS 121167]|uniref:Uncharacterized protein n=1 Tax=Aplosporella prunicola CBS 121167 TaxID=1176127 RepID=A0A6A6BPN6_9PEZI|nr:uncharacterized protein K452DRAFT_294670 [Aplosporella prunicola CBS 121167]KAF2146062.1 hypothetical protein K452DRAFT_294670 [Aplosporella prunicola CBS 121167]